MLKYLELLTSEMNFHNDTIFIDKFDGLRSRTAGPMNIRAWVQRTRCILCAERRYEDLILKYCAQILIQARTSSSLECSLMTRNGPGHANWRGTLPWQKFIFTLTASWAYDSVNGMNLCCNMNVTTNSWQAFGNISLNYRTSCLTSEIGKPAWGIVVHRVDGPPSRRIHSLLQSVTLLFSKPRSRRLQANRHNGVQQGRCGLYLISCANVMSKP